MRLTRKPIQVINAGQHAILYLFIGDGAGLYEHPPTRGG